MATNVAVKRNKNENNANLLKRFTRRVQGAGILSKVRSIRYLNRELSLTVRKKKKLNSIKRKDDILEKIKLGKMPEKQSRFKKR